MTEPQGAETPVIETPQVVEPEKVLPVIEKGEEPVTPKTETTPNIPNAEWQAMVERTKKLEEETENLKREKFEMAYPIVTNEKYKAKWQQMLTLKKTPGHKYSHPDFTYDDLRKAMIDEPFVPEMPKPEPPPVPQFTSVDGPAKTSGGLSPEIRANLLLRFSPEEIDAMYGKAA